MWDTFRLSAVGKFLFEKFAVLLVAASMSAFLMTAVIGPTAFAADATWKGDTITFNDQQYTKQSLTLPNTDPGSQVYVSTTDKSKVIIVPSNVDTSKDNTVQQVTYAVDENGNYSNPTGELSLSVGPQESANGTGTQEGQNKTSCAVTGIGWIVCSMSKFLAGAMDKAYGWIADFLVIKPLTTDTASGLFQTWNIARGVANACFIIAFLLIIYSQITSYGISNYEIKKMVPKLIIAALLVNVSYYVCAIAVDVSNILGESIARALIEVRASLPSPVPQMSWSDYTTYILSDATIVTVPLAVSATMVTVPLAVSASGGVLALVPMLVPMLIGGILSILVALMVLAARQALIIVLVVLAPLAFVAYLLPNTEKQFNRWRDLFMNMLIIFPLFSLLFGGAQLASSIIIQSTDKISVVLLAMFVQVAPLMITPFLMRFSNNLLTQLGGMVNDRNKGLVDRSRNWASEHSQLARERYRAKGATKTGRFAAATPSGMAYRLHRGKLHRQNSLKLYQDQIAATVANEKRAQYLMADSKAAALKKSAGEAIGERIFEERKATNDQDGKVIQNYSGIQRMAQSQTKALQSMDDAAWEEAVTGKAAGVQQHRYSTFSHDAHIAHREHHIADSNAAIAQSLQKSQFAEELSTDVNLQMRAGGIGGEKGAIKVKAKAWNEVIQAGMQDVKDISTASDIKPGDLDAMAREFNRAIDTSDIASLRAHTDMLAASKDPGINRLRQLIKDRERDLRANDSLLETFRHHVNSSGDINSSAEDIGTWSRDNFDGWRSLEEIGSSYKTWKNMNVNTFSSMKASTQRLALQSVRDDGSWAITEKMAYEIIRSPSAWSNIKDEVKPLIEERAAGFMPVRGA